MRKERKLPSIVTLAILTSVTAVFWLFFSAFRTFTKKGKVEVPFEILAPLNSQLDQKALEILDSRYYIEENQIPDTTIIIPPPTPTTTSVPSGTGEEISNPSLQETSTASPSANL